MAGNRLSKEERSRIRKERKELRKELKSKGIKSRIEFEQIAGELGLALQDSSKLGGILWFSRSWSSFRLFCMKYGLRSLLFSLAALLTAGFVWATITEEAGSFTINLTAKMMQAGFILATSWEFDDPSARLFSERLEDVNNITLDDISRKVDEVDGSHNGKNYIAYTFYIKNTGKNAASYQYQIKFKSVTKHLDQVVWVMLYEDGRQIIYADLSADGDPEALFGYEEPPFAEASYHYEQQYFEENGSYGIETTPFATEDIVAQGLVEMVEPETIHKYTAVIWIEGNDPECTNEMLGGYAKLSFDFDLVDEDKDKTSIFDGLFRTEYSDYIEERASELE